MSKTRTKQGLPVFTTTATETVDVDVDVEIEPDDLHDAGWHHESECNGVPVGVPSLGNAVASLHRQAHPGQARSVRLCHEEPCRSLLLVQLDEVDG